MAELEGDYLPPEYKEKEMVEVGRLDDFDMEYFQSLEGEEGWIAIGQENCENQKYYTVIGTNNEKLGIVGVYDTDDEKNITHIVVDPKRRGKGLLQKFYDKLMEKENLEYLTATVDIDNIASAKSHEKAGFKKTSDEAYEKEFHKFRYRYQKNKKGGKNMNIKK